MTDPQPYMPMLVTGPRELVWRDEFSGDSLDEEKWTRPIWSIQNVLTNPDNTWVYGGNLVLNLSAAKVGALVRSTFEFMPKMVVEFQTMIPGSDFSDRVWNWPCVWTSGVYTNGRTLAGEHDIAEGLKPGLKAVYWDRDRMQRSALPAGDWNGWHTFALHRGVASASYWWDGKRVFFHPTNDNGGPQNILASLGATAGETPVLGTVSRMRINYVRVWKD